MNFSTRPPKRSISDLTPLVVGRKDGPDVLGVQALRPSGEPHQVDEEHGDDLALLA
jgi:hypothetical protein